MTRNTILQLLIGAISFCLYSCNNELGDITESNTDLIENNISAAALSIPDTTSYVSTSTAILIAQNILSFANDSRALNDEMDVSDLYDTVGNRIAYIVNIGENNSVLVSSDKNKHPIIAVNTTGTFNIKENSVLHNWLVEISSLQLDSIGKKLASAEWNILTMHRQSRIPESRSTGDSYVDQIINQAISKWRQQGYDVICAKDANPDSYPTAIANMIRTVKSQQMIVPNPAESSFILIQTTSISNRVNPSSDTDWFDGYPYNAAVKNGRTLGAGVTALAQIMRYHNFPSYLNLASMPVSLDIALSTDPLPKALVQIGTACGCKYGSSSDTISISHIQSGLHSLGYSSAYEKFNMTNVFNSLRNYGPVYLEYHKGNKSAEWVCDGYSIYSTTTSYQFKQYTGDFADIDPTAAFATLTTASDYSTGVPAIHMDWGGGNRGFYYDTRWTLRQDFVIDGKDVESLINITPR